METEQFEALMMYVLVGGLILFMFFIIWDLAKKSKAGRLGTAILFLGLGLQRGLALAVVLLGLALVLQALLFLLLLAGLLGLLFVDQPGFQQLVTQ